MRVFVYWEYGVCYAVLNDYPEISGSGKSETEAIGDLIMSHQELCHFEIREDKGKQIAV
ncbi:MAG: hypothetical protein HYS51_01510 [Candidatus Zambryskibacteria bacterium]|nr:hypothetical protein [Candidatus Zambryskibacteria bacterium]